MSPLPSPPLALVVTDMSGFTRTTRKYGIVHMTSLIWKTRQTLRALFAAHHAISIRTEADNNFATFADPADALAAALQVQRVIDAQNATADETMQITMGGVGVAFGEVKETEHLFSGGVFFEAFTLGEDVSEKREVLVTKAVKEAVDGTAGWGGVTFEEKVDEGFQGGDREFFRVEGMPEEVFEADPKGLMGLVESAEVARSVGYGEEEAVVRDFIAPMLRRFVVSGEERTELDRAIEAQYLRDVAVLMYGAGWDAVAEKHGMEKLEQLQAEAKSVVDRVVAGQYGGEVVEDALFIFPGAMEAVAAAAALREAFREGGIVPYTGFGVHVGKVLYARGTDVHWGDPVNTSSKLGQDYCKDGEVVVSHKAWEEAKRKATEVAGEVGREVLGAEAEVVEGIRISGVDFKAYSIA